MWNDPHMPRRPTLQDVARRAGVSRSSASYVYTRPGRVSPALRARVLAAAAQLGYSGPDPTAAALRRGRAGAIGVLFTEALSYAFADPGAVLFLRGVAAAGERADVALTLLPVPPSFDPALAAIRNSVVDGVIVYSLPEEHPAVRVVAERRLPTVRVDMEPAPGAANVRIDDEGAARAVADHVLRRGHRRIALLADRLSPDDRSGFADAARRAATAFPVARWRLAGYEAALREHGLDPLSAPLYDAAGNTIEDGRAAAHALLAAAPRPTAILAMTDQSARGVLLAAHELGLHVPGDLAVAGFDDLPEAALTDPPLTTVHQDHAGKGEAAARLLFDGAPPGDLVLETRLVERAST
jgi:DNA-binding LacI/PurR family transcriptional regulator